LSSTLTVMVLKMDPRLVGSWPRYQPFSSTKFGAYLS